LATGRHLLCPECSSQISWCQPQGRCRSCFVGDEPLRCGLCERCSIRPIGAHRVAAALDASGPALSLAYRLSATGLQRIGGAMSNFIIAQLGQLGWPLPDRVVGIERCLVRRWMVGAGAAAHLARSVADQLSVPCSMLLVEQNGRLPQRALRFADRLELKGYSLILRRSNVGRDERLLLVEDRIVTGATIREASRCLQQLGPASICAMAFCR